MFDEIDSLARLMGETSCLSKRGGRLLCSAKDPISSGLAIEAFLPPGYWSAGGAEAFLLGAGGSSIAISWYLVRPQHGPDRPARIVVSNRSPRRLETIRRVHAELGTNIPVECVHTPEPVDNDRILARLVPALAGRQRHRTRQGRPGSPLTDAARFRNRQSRGI